MPDSPTITTNLFIYNFVGKNWLQSITPLRILVIFGLFRSYASTCEYIFWTLGKRKIQTTISLFQFVLIFIIIFPFINKFGIPGVALSVTFPLLISSIFSFYHVKRELDIQLRNIYEFLYSPIIKCNSICYANYISSNEL